MRANLMLSAALALVLTSTGAFAQSMQYDRTGDHMVSYGAVTAAPAQAHVRTPRHPARIHAVSAPQAPIDRTGDHMIYYGPVSQ
jgi:hypothetical protein